MNFLRRLQFRYLVRTRRFAEALAISTLHDSIESDRLWALYRLGCYRSVTQSGIAPRTNRDVVALAASLAACGEGERADVLIREAAAGGRLKGALLVEAVRALAPFRPELSLEIAAGLRGHEPLHAALYLAAGRTEEAAALIRRAAEAGKVARNPELYLLEACAAAEPDRILPLLNTYLEAHGLAPVARVEDGEPPNPRNLRSGRPLDPVRGPLVSITMPAYNVADRIGPAIRSLLDQTYRDIEIVVTDDASTDDTVAVVREIAAADERVRLLTSDVNGGPYVARNRAIEAATGVFVTCHDSDDWAHPEKIARQVEPLLRDPRLVFTMSNWVRMQDDGRFYARPVFPIARVNPASPLFRREEVLQRAGRYEPVRTGADSEYIARLKLVFGRRAWRKLDLPLALGAHRPGSLMTDASTGLVRGPMNPARLAYWEEWTARHIYASTRITDWREFARADEPT